MSHYSNYMKERGIGIIEDETGFITFTEQLDHLGNRVVYILDIYINDAYRQKGKGSQLADKVADIAREKKIKYLLGSTDLDRPNIELSFKSQMGYGFKVHAYKDNLIYWIKELK